MRLRFLPSTRGQCIRLSVLVLILVVVAVVFKIQAVPYRLGYTPREGDIIFQSLPAEELVQAIEGITHSPYSHCGVVLREGEKWVVIESIGNVHETPLFDWIVRGRGAGFAVYRLKPGYEKYLPQFRLHLLSYLGVPYDFDYEMSDKAIYCSELPYKAFQQAAGESLGTVRTLGELDWKPFEGFIRSIQGNRLPLDRAMITPEALSRATQLEEVYRKGI